MILIGFGVLVVLIYILKKLRNYSYMPKFTKGRDFERRERHNYLKGIKNIYNRYKGNKQRSEVINKLKSQLNLLNEAKNLGVIKNKDYGRISNSLKKETSRYINKNIQNLQEPNVNLNVMEKLGRIQDKIKPSHDEIRTNVYKMLEERGVDVGKSFIKEKNIPKTSKISQKDQIKKVVAKLNKEDMLKKIKEVYK